MECKFEATQINMFDVPTTKGYAFAGTSKVAEMKENEEHGDGRAPITMQNMKNKSTKTYTTGNPPPLSEEIEEEEEEEEDVATHLGGGEQLTGPLTMTDASLDKDNRKIKMSTSLSLPIFFPFFFLS